ncbi:MAG: endonuclease domain-containing protein [Pseudorhodoplanes sp.]|nr:endonuclease domain-containing protein [Pseudorhodoplanes sp.]
MANARARNLRANQTYAERKLWYRLRELKPYGFHFRRQVPIDHLIVDFACLSVRVVIEVDGGQHNTVRGQQDDKSRDAYLQREGFRILRFWNNDVLANLEGVMQSVCEALDFDHPHPSPRRGGA